MAIIAVVINAIVVELTKFEFKSNATASQVVIKESKSQPNASTPKPTASTIKPTSTNQCTNGHLSTNTASSR